MQGMQAEWYLWAAMYEPDRLRKGNEIRKSWRGRDLGRDNMLGWLASRVSHMTVGTTVSCGVHLSTDRSPGNSVDLDEKSICLRKHLHMASG